MSDKSVPQIVKATPQFVEGYGYLYLFDLTDGGRPFNHMSQVFLPRKMEGNPTFIYEQIRKRRLPFGYNSIVSINRNKPEKTPEATVENAKACRDKMIEEKRKIAEEARKKEESKKKDIPSREWLDNFFEEAKRKLKEQDEQIASEKAAADIARRKANVNWYGKITLKI